MFGGFSSQKLKPHLKMAVSRIQIASNKKSALLKQSMREVAVMLAEDPPKEEKAKIRAEALIRDDNMVEAFEILQLECELLHERIKLLEYSKQCPPDLVSVISTLMWASHRVDIPELMLIRKQFRAKYGKQFEENALENRGGVLNERVVSKLSVEPPAAYLVQTYLERICEQYEVDWKPKMRLSAEQMIEPMAAPVGYSVPVAQGTGLGPYSAVYAETGDLDAHNDDNDNDDNPSKFSGGGGGGGGGGAVLPLAPAAPYVPSGGASNHGSVNGPTAYAEPEVYVPAAAPTHTPGSGGGGRPSAPNSGDMSTIGSRSVSNGGHDDVDDNNNNDNAGRPGAGSSTSSYADLAARFNQLKK